MRTKKPSQKLPLWLSVQRNRQIAIVATSFYSLSGFVHVYMPHGLYVCGDLKVDFWKSIGIGMLNFEVNTPLLENLC